MNTPQRNFSSEYIAEVKQMLVSALMIAGMPGATRFDLDDFTDSVMVWFDGRRPQPRDYTSFDHLTDFGPAITTAWDLASANATLTGCEMRPDGTVRHFSGPVRLQDGTLNIADILKAASESTPVPISEDGYPTMFMSPQMLEAAHEALQPWHVRAWRRFKRWAGL